MYPPLCFALLHFHFPNCITEESVENFLTVLVKVRPRTNTFAATTTDQITRAHSSNCPVVLEVNEDKTELKIPLGRS